MTQTTNVVSRLVKASGGFVTPDKDGVVRTLGRSGHLEFTVIEAPALLEETVSVRILGMVSPQVAMQIAALVDGFPTRSVPVVVAPTIPDAQDR